MTGWIRRAVCCTTLGVVSLVFASIVAVSFLGMGALAWRRRPRGRVGVLAIAVGGLVLLDALPVGLHPALELVAALRPALLIHLLAALPMGRPRSPSLRMISGLGYLTPMVSDHDAPVAALLGAAVTGVQWVRWRHTTVPGRRSLTPVLAASAAVIVLVLARSPVWSVAGAARDGSLVRLVLVAVPLAYLAHELRTRFERGGVADLVVRLGTTAEPASLEPALARTLHDPTLTVGYWVAEAGHYLDARGRTVTLPEGAGRVATRIDRGGERVAVLLHDPALLADPTLIEAACAAAALALYSRQLAADHRRSVTRAAELERRRLERDLHDGVQQRLLSIPMALSVAESTLDADPVRARGLITEARGMSLAVLDELRALSQGMHPAVLTERGLAGAVRELTLVSPVPVRLAVDPPDRLPVEVEAAAYYVVAEALANVTKHARARRAEVRVGVTGSRLVVEVADDGRGGADPAGSGLRGLAARAEAIRGTLRITSPPGGGTRIVAELPCGS